MFNPFGSALKSNIPPAQGQSKQEIPQPVVEEKPYLTKSDVAPEGLTRASILAEYKGLESDIPIDHIYWTLT